MTRLRLAGDAIADDGRLAIPGDVDCVALIPAEKLDMRRRRASEERDVTAIRAGFQHDDAAVTRRSDPPAPAQPGERPGGVSAFVTCALHAPVDECGTPFRFVISIVRRHQRRRLKVLDNPRIVSAAW